MTHGYELTETAREFYFAHIHNDPTPLMTAGMEIDGKAVYLTSDEFKIHVATLPLSVAELVSEGFIRLFSWRLYEHEVVLTFKRC